MVVTAVTTPPAAAVTMELSLLLQVAVAVSLVCVPPTVVAVEVSVNVSPLVPADGAAIRMIAGGVALTD